MEICRQLLITFNRKALQQAQYATGKSVCLLAECFKSRECGLAVASEEQLEVWDRPSGFKGCCFIRAENGYCYIRRDITA